MKESFNKIYEYIIDSEDRTKMEVLGKVTKAMMYRLTETNPSLAKEYIELLESVRWNNYVTAKEAETIVSRMSPEPDWSKSSWNTWIEKYQRSEEPYFNENALYVTMSMISSDSGKTLQEQLNITDKKNLFDLIYHLAIDKLKDKDKMFNIRKYFNV